MATATATSPSWWESLATAATGAGTKIFESLGEGSSAFIQLKLAEKMGLMNNSPATAQNYYDVTAQPNYQAANQTATGQDYNGVPLGTVSVAGITMPQSTLNTALLVGGVGLAVLLGIKLLK